MDVNELLIPLDGPPDGAPPQALPAGKVDSQYRQALSRSLQTGKNVERPNAAGDVSENTTSALLPDDPAGNQDGSTPGEAVAAQLAAATQVHIVTAPAVEPDSGGNADVVQSETIELTPPNRAALEETAAAETIIVLSNDVPLPPADLASLFVTPNADDETEIIAVDSANAELNGELPSPPRSLFESVATIAPSQSAAPTPESSNPRGSGDAALIDAGRGVSVVEPSAADSPAVLAAAETQPREPQSEPPAEAVTAISVPARDEPTETNRGATVDPPAETQAPSEIADPTAVDHSTTESLTPPAAASSHPQQPAATAEPPAETPRRPDQPRRNEPPQAGAAIDRQPPVAEMNQSAPQIASTAIRGDAIVESGTLVDSPDGGKRPTATNRSESTQSSPLPPVGPGASPTSVANRTAPAVSSAEQADVDPQQIVARTAAAIRMATPNGRQLRIRLNPPHLGPLDVAVTSRDQVLSVRMEVQSHSAHSALVDNLAMLRGALHQQGAALDRIDVQLVEPAPEEGAPDFENGERQQPDSQTGHDQSQQQADEQSEESADTQHTGSDAVQAGVEELDVQV